MAEQACRSGSKEVGVRARREAPAQQGLQLRATLGRRGQPEERPLGLRPLGLRPLGLRPLGLRPLGLQLKLRRVLALGQATLMVPVRLVAPNASTLALVPAKMHPVRRRVPLEELVLALVRQGLRPGRVVLCLVRTLLAVQTPALTSVRQIGRGVRGCRRPCSATRLACY